MLILEWLAWRFYLQIVFQIPPQRVMRFLTSFSLFLFRIAYHIQVTATDGDKDRPQNIVYFLTGQGIDPDNPANSKFDINRTTGEIFVLKVKYRKSFFFVPSVVAADADATRFFVAQQIELNGNNFHDFIFEEERAESHWFMRISWSKSNRKGRYFFSCFPKKEFRK